MVQEPEINARRWERPRTRNNFLLAAVLAVLGGSTAGVVIGLRGPRTYAPAAAVRPASSARRAPAGAAAGKLSERPVSGIVIDRPKTQSLSYFRYANQGEFAFADEAAAEFKDSLAPDSSNDPEPAISPALPGGLDIGSMLGPAVEQTPSGGGTGLQRDGFVRKLTGDSSRMHAGGIPHTNGSPSPARAAAVRPFPKMKPLRIGPGNEEMRRLSAVARTRDGVSSALPANAAPLIKRLYQVGKKVHQRSLDTGAAAVTTPAETRALAGQLGVHIGEKDKKPAPNQYGY